MEQFFFSLGAVNKQENMMFKLRYLHSELTWLKNWHDFGEIEIDFRCLNRYEKWLIRYGYRCQCKYYNSDHFAWKLLQNSLKYPNYCFQNAKWSVWTKMRNGHSECLLRCDLIWNSTWTHLLHKYHFVQLEISENKKYPSDLLKWFGFFFKLANG